MDVPGAAVTAQTPTPLPAGTIPAPPPATHAAAATSGSGTPAAAAAPPQQSAGTLSPVVAKLFNASEDNVTVSFQVTSDPDEVVTVFTDKSTGKEIIQFPSQALIALAEMYDKDAGKVLDKSV
jgi:uncharacterized FlaG/YvyC family protein